MSEPPTATSTRLICTNTGKSKGCEPYDFGATVVVVQVTLHQGEWETHSQGKGWQVDLDDRIEEAVG